MVSDLNSFSKAALRSSRFILLIALALTVTLPPPQRVAGSPASLFGYSKQWGSFGGPPAPNMIAIDASGNMYVADSQNLAVGKLARNRSEEHTSELQSPYDLVCRLLLEK